MRIIYLLMLSLFLVACSSTQPKKEVTYTLTELLERADNLRRVGSTDEAAYKALSADFMVLSQTDKNYCSKSEAQHEAKTFIDKFTPLHCEAQVIEPAEKLFVKKGFVSPIEIHTACPATSPFTLEADSAAMAISGAGMNFKDGKMDARLRIESAQLDKEKNVISFGAHYFAEPLLKKLEADCEQKGNYAIEFLPMKYLVQATPEDTEDAIALQTQDRAVDSAAGIEGDALQAKLLLRFHKGSMRLSKDTRTALDAFKERKEVSLRITGYGDKRVKNAEKLANLRARATASYLEEYTDINIVEVKWSKMPNKDFPHAGVIIEEVR